MRVSVLFVLLLEKQIHLLFGKKYLLTDYTLLTRVH